MPEKPPSRFDDVERETLLPVEGIEDARFFNVFLCRLKRDNVQIARVGGKNNSRPVLTGILSKSQKFSRLRRLGIVRDADLSAESTLRSLRDALDAAHLPAPSQAWQVEAGDRLPVSLAIFPDELSQGNLEDLCLRSIENSPESSCVEQYVGCREGAGRKLPNKRFPRQGSIPILQSARMAATPVCGSAKLLKPACGTGRRQQLRRIIGFLRSL